MDYNTNQILKHFYLYASEQITLNGRYTELL